MAKTLRCPPPSSSVARLLDPVAAARAIQPAAACQPDPLACPPPTMSAASAPVPSSHVPDLVKREIVLTPEADATLEQLVNLYRRTTHTRLSTSHVIRTILLAVKPRLDSLRDELARVGPLRLPSNARGQEAQRRQFELLLARAFASAMRQGASNDLLPYGN